MRVSVPHFAQAQVLVIGDVMLDRYWSGATSRISPEAPVPVVQVSTQQDKPGGGANVAINLANLGVQTALMGVIGYDEAGTVLQQLLADSTIQSGLIQSEHYPTITKLRVLSRHQQLIRLDFEPLPSQQADPAVLARITTQLTQYIDNHVSASQHPVLILSDYNKGMLRHAPAFIQIAQSAGIRVLVDPKGNDFNRYRGAFLLTPNRAELEAVIGHCPDDDQLIVRTRALLDQLAIQAILITRSEQGMTLVTRDQTPYHLSALARDVFDVTGAGDTVIAVLAASISAGLSLPDAIVLANLAAGIVVGKLGTASVTTAELTAALTPQDQAIHRVLDSAQLQWAIKAARARGEKIVMTNGCFDLLHQGHVHYLEQAKALGDRLIVATNTDASIKRLKGEKRPVMPLSSRAQVLASLAFVDWVICFDEDTPAHLIEQLLPDILVKGGDNQVELIPGAQAVLAAGGQVKILDYIEGHSTSAAIARIEDKATADE